MRNAYLFLLVVIMLFTLGCAMPASVKDINTDTDKYLGKKVVVSGEVKAPLDVGPVNGFMLHHDGSTLMVSSEEVPEKGSDVVVQGTVVKGLFSGHYIYADSVR